MVYMYIWFYKINPSYVEEFEKEYGANGKWIKLFQNSPHYQETILLKNSDQPHSYRTIDIWDNYEAYINFKTENEKEFNEIDNYCEQFTLKEQFEGNFEKIK